MKNLIGLVFIATFAITAAAAWKTERKIDEMTDAVSYIIDTFGDPVGDAPAFALWARHVRGLYLDGYSVLPESADPRPDFVFRDVSSFFEIPAES